MKAFLVFLVLVMASVMCQAKGSSEPFCSWDHPGANKYQQNPVKALDDYYMDFQVRAALKAKMELHQYDDIVEIRRDGVFGHGVYSNLRDMHYGKGMVCPGKVDTQMWAPDHVERALVYCENSVCVAVPTVCNNVSLVTRQEDNPIEISPSAGSQGGGGSPGSSQPAGDVGTAELGQGANPTEVGPVAGDVPETLGGTWSSYPGLGGWPGGWEGGGGGGPIGPGCGCQPPPPPVCPPPSTVPENSEWAMIIAGLISFVWLWNRRDKRK